MSKLKALEEGDFKGADMRRQLPAQLTKDLEYEVSRILDHDFKFVSSSIWWRLRGIPKSTISNG
jgi:hypothetical protein